MAVYIIPIVVLYFFSYVKGKDIKKNIFIISCLYLAIISGIRFEVGTDYDVQISYYEWTVQGLTDSFLEPGFRYYIRFINRFFGDKDFFFLFASFFVMFAFAFAIVKFVDEEYRIMSLSLYITTTIFFATMNIERQYIAIGFLVFSLYFFKEKKYLFTILMYAIAISFHQSAVLFGIFYILYLLLNYGKNLKIMWIMNGMIIFSSVWMLFDFRPIIKKIARIVFLDKYVSYLDSSFFQTREMDSVFKCIIPLIIWFVIIYKYNALKEKESNIDYFIPCYFLYVFINNMFYGINVFIRMNMYFEWIIILLFPSLVSLGKDAMSRFSIKTTIMLYYLLLTVYGIFINNGHAVLPYQTIFQ
jgi:hypothetical protein